MSETRIPSNQTLKKYGLSLQEWQSLYNKYDGCCHICRKSLDGRLACVDHEHSVSKAKFKRLSPEDKKKLVRGILCYTCNFVLVRRGITPERLRRAEKYLEEYERLSKRH